MSPPPDVAELRRNARERADAKFTGPGRLRVINGSSEDNQAFRLHETTSLKMIEVHPTGKIGGVELDLVVAGVDIAIGQFRHSLTEQVGNGDYHVRMMRETETNCC